MRDTNKITPFCMSGYSNGMIEVKIGVTLKPVGHQSTNWMVLFVLMVAIAAFTSLGTTSPLLVYKTFTIMKFS